MAKPRRVEGDMQITLYVCENCKKESRDYMGDGWLMVRKLTKYYKGRNDNGSASAEIFINESEPFEKYFCSWKCLESK